jgi:hypothetical protein
MHLSPKTPNKVASKFFIFLFSLAGTQLLSAQVTTINVNNQVLQSPVKRFGINLGSTTFYDSGQMLKNLITNNPGFEGEIAQSMLQCGSGTATSCTHPNYYSGWGADFWDGASYQFIYGSALGRSGTVSKYVAASIANSTGGVFNFADSGTAPGNNDYMIVRKAIPGNATDGWQVNLNGGASITTNFSDLPPGTNGIQTAFFNAPVTGGSATLSAYFDSTPGRTFLQMNGQYQLTFKAKGLGGSSSVAVNVGRSTNPQTFYINSTINLTNNWQTYTLTFNPTENGWVVGTGQVQFSTVGPDSFYLDDVSLVQLNTDPTNATVFRDPVVNALKQLNPGVMRFWFNQLGESLDNMLAPPLGRQRSTYSSYTTDINFVEYGLTDFLQLCQTVGADPWVVVPITFSNTEASNLIDYLAGSTSTVYGAKRAAAGQTAPWTSVFNKIHLEFGNESWNTIFNGGDMENWQAYGTRTNAVFAAMRGNSSFNAPSFDLIMNGFSEYPAATAAMQRYCTTNDSVGAAPYMMYNVNDPGTTGTALNENLFGSAFAEAEAFVTNSGTAEGVANGYILQNQQVLAPFGKPFVGTEINMSPLAGNITQAELDGFSSSIGAGLAVVDAMLQQLRVGVLTQNLFQLAQYQYTLPVLNNQTRTTSLWGSVLDMGVTDWRRPQFLALQMANAAISTSSATMLQTVHTGADPTWNQPLVQTAQLNNAHYLQSFAFNNANQYSLIVFNTNRTNWEPVTFAGGNVPAGTVQMQQLTSANITDTNENSLVVSPVSSTLNGFNPAAQFWLPPFSMTVLSWTAPQISGVTVTGVTATSATISWNTDVPASGQVAFGTTSAYGSLSTFNGAATTQSITLTGLNPATTYNFAAVATNAAGATASSANGTFSTPGFAISAPASITMQQGQQNSYPVTVTGSNGFSAPVALSLSGLPPGTSSTVQTTQTGATLTISIAATASTGTFPLTLSGTSGSLTLTAPISLVVTAPIQYQTITFNALPSQSIGSTLTVSATASSGLPVIFSLVQNGNCSISGNVVTFLNPGNCGVIANQPGNSTYAAAPSVGQVVVVTAPTPPPGAQACASETGTCTIPQATTANVYYGANGRYYQRTLTGTFTCTSNIFGGDPAYGVVKACYPVASTLPPGATGCAVDFGTCTIPAGSTAEVYYGANGIYIYKALSGGSFSCAPSTFGGDPLYGTLKSCYPVISVPPSTAKACASEGGSCSIPAASGKVVVYYGANGIYLNKTLSGTFACSTATFGTDPTPGGANSCLY